MHAQLHAVDLMLHVVVLPAPFKNQQPGQTRRQQVRQVGVRRDARVQADPVHRQLALGRGGFRRVIEPALRPVTAFARAHVVAAHQLPRTLRQLLHEVRLEETQQTRDRLHAVVEHAGLLRRCAKHRQQTASHVFARRVHGNLHRTVARIFFRVTR